MHYQLLMSCSSKHIALVFNWKILRSLHTESENSHHIPLTLRQSHLHIASETFVHQNNCIHRNNFERLPALSPPSIPRLRCPWARHRTPNCSPGAAAYMAAHCSGCVFMLCVCVHFGWYQYRALILSIGYHTWPRMSRHFHIHLIKGNFMFHFVYTFLFRNDIVQ